MAVNYRSVYPNSKIEPEHSLSMMKIHCISKKKKKE